MMYAQQAQQEQQPPPFKPHSPVTASLPPDPLFCLRDRSVQRSNNRPQVQIAAISGLDEAQLPDETLVGSVNVIG